MADLQPLIRVFISSKQSEFRAERAAIADTIGRLPLLAADFAEDWAPERGAVRNTFLSRVQHAPIYVALFGCVYSPATVLEYEMARANPRRELLIYVRNCPGPGPEMAALRARLDDPETGHTIRVFEEWSAVASTFERHLWEAVSRMIEHYMLLSQPAPETRSFESVRGRRWREHRDGLLALGLMRADDPDSARECAHLLREMLRDAGAPEHLA